MYLWLTFLSFIPDFPTNYLTCPINFLISCLAPRIFRLPPKSPTSSSLTSPEKSLLSPLIPGISLNFPGRRESPDTHGFPAGNHANATNPAFPMLRASALSGPKSQLAHLLLDPSGVHFSSFFVQDNRPSAVRR